MGLWIRNVVRTVELEPLITCRDHHGLRLAQKGQVCESQVEANFSLTWYVVRRTGVPDGSVGVNLLGPLPIA